MINTNKARQLLSAIFIFSICISTKAFSSYTYYISPDQINDRSQKCLRV